MECFSVYPQFYKGLKEYPCMEELQKKLSQKLNRANLPKNKQNLLQGRSLNWRTALEAAT